MMELDHYFLQQKMLQDSEDRRDGEVRVAAALLDDHLINVHPYNVTTAADLYRHFDKRKTLADIEREHPTGPDWNAQFRFALR